MPGRVRKIKKDFKKDLEFIIEFIMKFWKFLKQAQILSINLFIIMNKQEKLTALLLQSQLKDIILKILFMN